MKTLVLLMCGALFTFSLPETSFAAEAVANESEVRKKQIEQLRAFSARKAKQAETLAGDQKVKPEFREFFDAAEKGKGQEVTNRMEKLRGFISGESQEQSVHSYWQPVLEISLGYAEVIDAQPEHVELAITEFFKSIPAGAIYFGGTDAGRGLPTAFSTDHAAGKPFLTLTQNPLADETYMDYLRAMYGAKMKIPDKEGVQKAFAEYIQDASERVKSGNLKAGENVTVHEGRISIQGHGAVMEVNARILKQIVELNKDREFFIEQSYPMDWTYPHLSPDGLVMKLNVKPLEKISEEEVRKDHEYWRRHTRRFVGEWLTEKTGPADVCAFVRKTHGDRNFSGFAGDRGFIEDSWARRCFGKWRSSMGGVYAWRATQAGADDRAESKRMQKAAEAAFAQAFALDPKSPETVHGYVNLMVFGERFEDAIVIAETALKLAPESEHLRSLVNGLSGKGGK